MSIIQDLPQLLFVNKFGSNMVLKQYLLLPFVYVYLTFMNSLTLKWSAVYAISPKAFNFEPSPTNPQSVHHDITREIFESR